MTKKLSLQDAKLILQEARYLEAFEIVAKANVDTALTAVMVFTADAAAAAVALVKAVAVIKSIADVAEAEAKLEETTQEKLDKIFPEADANYTVVPD